MSLLLEDSPSPCKLRHCYLPPKYHGRWQQLFLRANMSQFFSTASLTMKHKQQSVGMKENIYSFHCTSLKNDASCKNKKISSIFKKVWCDTLDDSFPKLSIKSDTSAICSVLAETRSIKRIIFFLLQECLIGCVAWKQ